MKTEKKEVMYKVIYTCALLLIAFSSYAKESKESKGFEKTKVYEDSFAVDPLIMLNLDINESSVKIITSDQPQLTYTYTVRVRAEDEEGADRFIQNTMPSLEKTPNEIKLYMKLCGSKIQINNNRKKIKFSEGPWIKFTDYSMDLVITIPKTMMLDLNGSNNNVTLGDLDKDLKLKLYDSTLRAGKVKGNSIIELSYGDAYFASLNSVEKMKLYEMKFEAAEVLDDIDLKTSYSRVTMPDLDHLMLRSYEDHLVFSKIEDLKGQMSYSNLSASEIKEWDAKAYESIVTIGEVDGMDLVSQYSTFNIGKVNALDLRLQYPDIDYPAGDFNGLFEKEGEKVTTVLVHKKGDANSAKFIFDTYEGQINIDKAIAR